MIEEIKSKLMVNGRLVPKRCLLPYLTKVGLWDRIIESTPTLDHLSPGNRIKSILLGVYVQPICHCGSVVPMVDGKWQKHCSLSCATKGRVAPNKIDYDRVLLRKLYVEERLSPTKVAEKMGTSYATVRKWLKAEGIEKRSHSEETTIANTGREVLPKWNVPEMIRLYGDGWNQVRLAEEFGVYIETIRRHLITNNVERRNDRSSYLEDKVELFLKEIGVSYVPNTRSVIKPYEVDFYLPDYKLAIELHGLFYHSVVSGNKPRDYHFQKYALARENGVRLLQFWQTDIDYRFPAITNIIRNAVGLTSRKYDARKCELKPVRYNEASEFYEKNHIQGKAGRNCRSVGLYFEDKLVALIGYTVTKEKSTILRYCTELGSNVRGGFTRLLKQVPGSKIATYSHNDISDGKLYSTNGFECVAEGDGDLWYTDYSSIYNRQKFMKSRLVDFPAYSEDKTEQEIMVASGYDMIYKSGTKTWVLNR